MTLEALIPHLGYVAVLVGTFLEGETVLVLGGFAAHQGYLRLPWVIAAAFLGTLAGDLLFFFLGRRHSGALLRRRPDWEPRLARARRLIERHRTGIILAFRFLYGLRTVIPFALGMSGMPVRLFAPLNVIGALVWAAAVGSAGYFFGHALEVLLGEVRHYELWIMLALAALGGGLWLAHFLRHRPEKGGVKEDELSKFWSLPAGEVLSTLHSTTQGLTAEEAGRRGAQVRPEARKSGPARALSLLVAQFGSPIILLLVIAAGLSFFLHDPADALIILAIVLASGLLGFWQEWQATDAVRKLLAQVQVLVRVRRDGRPVEIPQEQVVPGDIVEFAAGDVIPGDCLLLEATDLFVDEAALTGETFPAEKAPGVLPAESPLLRRTNAVFMGTHVVSGSGRAVVVRTGPETEFGKIAGRLRLRPPETEFERGVRRFGNFLLEVTLLLVMGIFVINVYLDRPVLQSFLFALALAVGLTPQLLPAIISVNLSHGAKRMARQKVIVKRLAAIENFGSMNVLCVDKTGTLTEGSVRIAGMFDLSGKEYRDVLFYAALNARFETGYRSPVDEALRAEGTLDFGGWEKRGELPYDFVRKRLSVLAEKAGKRTLVTKGAVDKVLDVCETARAADGSLAPLAQVRDAIDRRYHDLSGQGLRLLGVAVREAATAPVARDQEADMTFLGFLALHDPPKAGIAETVTALAEQGVALKIVTGDNRPVTEAVAGQVGLPRARLLTGPQLRGLSDEALIQRVGETDIFAEVEPDQKERIIRACQKAGHVVGYLGDGINDATALHAADVGLSVDSAVDVAKEAADIVLLEKDLAVLLQGVREGRETFANTLKYVFMATSANFGNMFSMAGISLVLPFLPLLPKQILLTNLLTDFPEMAIANDRVDRESLQRPRRWDLAFIRRFMLTFGLLSSLFDYLTFAVLLLLLRASPEQFRSGWFMESVVSATLVVLVIRTRRPLWRSRPGRALVTATLAVIAATGLLPFSPLAVPMGFVPLPPAFLAGLAAIVILYALAAEVTKKFFYRQMDPGRAD